MVLVAYSLVPGAVIGLVLILFLLVLITRRNPKEPVPVAQVDKPALQVENDRSIAQIISTCETMIVSFVAEGCTSAWSCLLCMMIAHLKIVF